MLHKNIYHVIYEEREDLYIYVYTTTKTITTVELGTLPSVETYRIPS